MMKRKAVLFVCPAGTFHYFATSSWNDLTHNFLVLVFLFLPHLLSPPSTLSLILSFCFLWFLQIGQLHLCLVHSAKLHWGCFSEMGYNPEELIMNSLKNVLECVCPLNIVLSQQHLHPSRHDLTVAPIIYSTVLQWAHSISSTLSGNNKLKK